MSWSPLFASIVTSTLWDESKEVRLLFLTILAMKNQKGFVPASSVNGLARMANLELSECEEALGVLEAPDRKDPSQEFEGRRIERVDGGWLVLNHEKYQKLLREVKRKDDQAQWQRDNRKNKKSPKNNPGLAERNFEKKVKDREIDLDRQPINGNGDHEM